MTDATDDALVERLDAVEFKLEELAMEIRLLIETHRKVEKHRQRKAKECT